MRKPTAVGLYIMINRRTQIKFMLNFYPGENLTQG